MPETKWDLSLELRCDRTAPSEVRHALSDLAEADWAIGDLMVVVSELVANAVQHSGAEPEDTIRVEIRGSPESLLVSVCDPGASGKTAELRPGPSPFGGLGLRLVEQLTSRWGAEKRPGGCHRVWAEINPPRAMPDPAGI